MKESGISGITYFLCIIVCIYSLSAIPSAGIRVLLPVYAYSGLDEIAIWDNLSETQAEIFLPVYVEDKRSLIQEKRKDIFTVKALEKGEMLTLMELENSSLGHEVADNRVGQADSLQSSQENEEGHTDNHQNEQHQGGGEQISDALKQTENTSDAKTGGFVKHEKIAPIDLSELSDYETLVKRFYTIDAITTIGADELSAQKLGNADLTMKQTPDVPQILIYHTHSQEGYVDSVPGDDSTTIMGVGEHLKEILEQQYEYNVLHHWGKYDVETRDNAYSQSLPEIQRILAENPSIEVVIDLHRDGVADESTRLVTDIDGRPTAQFMLFNGISRTKSTGKIDYLYNENLQTNLAFSFQMKWKAEEYYPGLTRRNYLNAYRYNMHVCPKTLLLELGAQTNTLEEAMNACDPIAHILHIVLTGE